MLLNGLGVTCVSLASNGQEAFEQWKQGAFDIVLMDGHMPVMDGNQATYLIREHERKSGKGSHQVIVGLSAGALTEDRSVALASGMDDYLAKPVKRSDLSRCLDRWGRKRAPHL